VQFYLYDDQNFCRKLSREERKHNAWGLHLKDHRLATTDLCTFFAACNDIETLEIYGCNSAPKLRLCHDCDDVFANAFAPFHYSNLSSLLINYMYISGGRLRNFVKHHAATLTKVDIYGVALTDGTWRSIAQGLAKCPRLTQLGLIHLRQKQSVTGITPPPEYLGFFGVGVIGTGEIQDFLKSCIAFFDTVLYVNDKPRRKLYPKYYDAVLYQLLGMSVVLGGMKSGDILQRYAEVDEIVEN